MIQKVIFCPPAVEDVVEAAAWYEAHAAGLGEQLIDEILSATRRAQDGPELFRVVHRDGNVRRVLTNRFPYRIFSRLSARRSTFTRFFTARGTIVDGQSDCERRSISLLP
jgi:plasmid stabilization system protein ParE